MLLVTNKLGPIFEQDKSYDDVGPMHYLVIVCPSSKVPNSTGPMNDMSGAKYMSFTATFIQKLQTCLKLRNKRE